MSLADTLRQALGADFIGQQEPLQVDGVAISLVVTPPDAEQLAATLRCVKARGLKVLVCGGGSRLGLGNPPRGADMLLSTAGLSGIRELDADEGIACAAAGTPLAELRERARAEGWDLPLDPPGTASTLGGALASAARGPRFGHPRSCVLGLGLVHADGGRTRCGGRVVKNVTGYDLIKLYVGSLGSLGVIESAWLRLRPLPEEVRVLRLPASAEDFEGLVAIARRATVRVAALLSPSLVGTLGADTDGEAELVIELAGDAPAVARDRASLLERGAEDVGEDRVAAVREVQAGDAYGEELRLRLRCLPSRLESAWRCLGEAGGACLAYPARGDLFARFAGDDPHRADAIFSAAERAAEVGRGSYLVEAAPLKAKEGRDVFGQRPEVLPLFRALKRAFDPDGLLNPGRFAGHL